MSTDPNPNPPTEGEEPSPAETAPQEEAKPAYSGPKPSEGIEALRVDLREAGMLIARAIPQHHPARAQAEEWILEADRALRKAASQCRQAGV